jgi:outer membrane protein assembly factor BamD
VLVSRDPKVGLANTILAATAAVLLLSGCAGKTKRPELAYEERPVELLYSTGADRLDKRRWTDAVDYFREVERQHPYSEWSRRAILMTAYAHYEANQYADALADADRFIQLYPGNPSAVYAYYLRAICYFEQIVDVGRDQAATEQALNALREVTQRFPNSEYAQDARLKVDMVNDQLAGKEMTIGRYYLRNGQTLAAIGRFRTVVDRYQTASHTPEALYRLVEAYLTIGLADEAKRNGSVLGYNYPGDAWYSDGYKLLTSNNLRPSIEPKSPGAKRSYLQRLIQRKDDTLPPPGEARKPEGFIGGVLGL